MDSKNTELSSFQNRKEKNLRSSDPEARLLLALEMLDQWTKKFDQADSLERLRADARMALMQVLDCEQVQVFFQEEESPVMGGMRSSLLQLVGEDAISGVIRASLPRGRSDFTELDFSLAQLVARALDSRLRFFAHEKDLQKSLYSAIEALAASIETRDRYTGGHTRRVLLYADEIAKYMDLTPAERENVRLAGLLHDLGKIGVSDAILYKTSSLSELEWIEMEKHADIGFQIVSRVRGLEEVAEILRYHHERWNGTGYPLGLRESQIPKLSRVISVADCFDAIVTDRPYRSAMDPAYALKVIAQGGGVQFDPQVVIAFEKAFAEMATMSQRLKPSFPNVFIPEMQSVNEASERLAFAAFEKIGASPATS